MKKQETCLDLLEMFSLLLVLTFKVTSKNLQIFMHRVIWYWTRSVDIQQKAKNLLQRLPCFCFRSPEDSGKFFRKSSPQKFLKNLSELFFLLCQFWKERQKFSFSLRLKVCFQCRPLKEQRNFSLFVELRNYSWFRQLPEP